jgi:hypothetical protein
MMTFVFLFVFLLSLYFVLTDSKSGLLLANFAKYRLGTDQCCGAENLYFFRLRLRGAAHKKTDSTPYLAPDP